jgi:hypothetical protein
MELLSLLTERGWVSALPFHEKAGRYQELLRLGPFISDVFLCPDNRQFLAGEAAVKAERVHLEPWRPSQSAIARFFGPRKKLDGIFSNVFLTASGLVATLSSRITYFTNARGNRRNKHDLARALSEFVQRNVDRAKPIASFAYGDAPNGFDSVVIVAESAPGDWWGGEVGGIALGDVRTQVEMRIAAKDNLVSTYGSNLPRDAELWLLLYSGMTVARSMPIPRGIDAWPIPFQFDRVFWFTSLDRQFVEIQKA